MGLLNTNTVMVTIKREVRTDTASKSKLTTYTTAARGSLPTSLSARVMQPGATERFKYSMREQQFDVALLFQSDPSIDTRDRCEIGSRILFVQTCRDVQNLGRLWIATLTENDSGVQ